MLRVSRHHGLRGYGRSLFKSQWLFLVLLIGLPLPTWAGGFWNLDRGPSHFARGGADIAAPRGPIAVYTNPAALAGLKGLQLNIDANLVYDQRSFLRAADTFGEDANAFTRTYAKSDNLYGVDAPSPGMFLSYNFASLGLEDLTLGLGFYGPPKSDTVFPADPKCTNDENCPAGQRYSLLESHNLQIHTALAAGYALPWWGLKVGFNFMFVHQIVDTTLALHVGLPGGLTLPEDPDYDIAVHAQASEYFIPTGVLALSATPVPWLTVAVSYQHSYDVAADGTAELTLGSELDTYVSSIDGNQINVELKMPSVLRASVMYQDPAERFDIEFAFVWEQWSRNDLIRFNTLGIEANLTELSQSLLEVGPTLPVDAVSINNQWKDSFSVRLGGSVLIIEDLLRVHAGVFYEESAVPAQYTNPSSMDLDKWGLTTGARIEIPGGFWLDLATGYTFWLPREINNSLVNLENPLLEDYVPYPIGNGRYENGQFTVQAGLGATFDL